MDDNIVDVPPRKRIKLSLLSSGSYAMPYKNTETVTGTLSLCGPLRHEARSSAERFYQKNGNTVRQSCAKASDYDSPFRIKLQSVDFGNSVDGNESKDEGAGFLSSLLLDRPRRGNSEASSSSLQPIQSLSFTKQPKRLQILFWRFLRCTLKRMTKGWCDHCLCIDVFYLFREVLHRLLASMVAKCGDMVFPLISKELAALTCSFLEGPPPPSLHSRCHLELAFSFALKSICSPKLARSIQIWYPGSSTRGVSGHQLVSISQMTTCIQKAGGKLNRNLFAALVSSIIQAEDLHQQKAFVEAKHMFQMAFNIHNESFGSLGPLTTYLLNRLGNLCSEIQDFDAALSYYYEGLKVERCLHGEGSAEVLVTTTNIACIHRQRGQYDRALKYFILACEMQAILEGPTSLQVALTHANIGLMWFQLEYFEYSYEAYRESLRIRQLHCGKEGSLLVASSLNSVGLAAFKIGQYNEARSCVIRSFEMAKRYLGDDNEELAVLASNVATVLAETGETGSSVLPYYLEILRIERSHHGGHHPKVVGFIVQVGHNMEMLGEREVAITLYKEALQIERQRENRDSHRMILLLRLIGNIQLQLGSMDFMMESFSEASRLRQQLQGSCLLFASTGLHVYCLDKINPLASPVA